MLLEMGADVEVKDKYRRTALHSSIFNGHEAGVWLLLEMGAGVEAKKKLLLEKVADVGTKIVDG